MPRYGPATAADVNFSGSLLFFVYSTFTEKGFCGKSIFKVSCLMQGWLEELLQLRDAEIRREVLTYTDNPTFLG